MVRETRVGLVCPAYKAYPEHLDKVVKLDPLVLLEAMDSEESLVHVVPLEVLVKMVLMDRPDRPVCADLLVMMVAQVILDLLDHPDHLVHLEMHQPGVHQLTTADQRVQLPGRVMEQEAIVVA